MTPPSTRRIFLQRAAGAATGLAGAGAIAVALVDDDEPPAPPRSTAPPGTTDPPPASTPSGGGGALTEAATYTGVAVRGTDPDTAALRRRFPWLAIVGAYVRWRELEPARGQLDWGAVDAALVDARANGYKVVLRIECGHAAPDWIYRGGEAVRRVDLVHRGRPAPIPLPWDPNLLGHYRALLGEVEGHLADDPARAAHVYFVPVAMPTQVGTEMAMGYGGDPANRAAWAAIGPEPERQELLAGAWDDAVLAHTELLRSAPSCIAYGPLFADRYRAAGVLAREHVARNRDRLWSMTTNLQCGAGGSFAAWNADAAGTIQAVRDAGGVVGFQTAALGVLRPGQGLGCAAEDGLRYGMRFLETSPELAAAAEPYLQRLQARIARNARP